MNLTTSFANWTPLKFEFVWTTNIQPNLNHWQLAIIWMNHNTVVLASIWKVLQRTAVCCGTTHFSRYVRACWTLQLSWMYVHVRNVVCVTCSVQFIYWCPIGARTPKPFSDARHLHASQCGSLHPDRVENIFFVVFRYFGTISFRNSKILMWVLPDFLIEKVHIFGKKICTYRFSDAIYWP